MKGLLSCLHYNSKNSHSQYFTEYVIDNTLEVIYNTHNESIGGERMIVNLKFDDAEVQACAERLNEHLRGVCDEAMRLRSLLGFRAEENSENAASTN